MTQTLRNALIGAYWERPFTTHMARAVMDTSKAPEGKFSEVCGIIDRHFKGDDLPNFDSLVAELAKALDYKEPEAPQPMPLCEAISRELLDLENVSGWVRLSDVQAILNARFAALSAEEVAEVVVTAFHGEPVVDGDREMLYELSQEEIAQIAAQAVMRLLSKE